MQLSMAEFFESLLVLQLNLSATKFKVPETYIYLFRDLGVGYFRKVRRRAYLEGSENWTYI